MTTAARYAAATLVEPPTSSATLVPLAGDRKPPARPPAKPDAPANAHLVFNGSWYAGVGLYVVAAGVGVYEFGPMEAAYVLGSLLLVLGGLGGLVHTLWKPSERKTRHALGAIAALVLAIACTPVLRRISTEVHASAQVQRLEPLAQAVIRDGRIREIGLEGSWVKLNGYHGPEHATASSPSRRDTVRLELDDVLRRDGMTRAELTAHLRRLDRGGIRQAIVTPGFVALYPHDGSALLFVPPGHPLPARSTRIGGDPRWRTEPLGGGWFLLLD